MAAYLLVALCAALIGADATASARFVRGLSDVTRAAKGRFIVFGEMHGSVGGPAFFGDTTLALAGRGEHVLVAFELLSTSNAALQVAWAGPAAGFEDRLIATMPDWKGMGTGVASRAMLDLIIRLHDAKLAGSAIDIVAFTGFRDPAELAKFRTKRDPKMSEAAMAANIRFAADAGRYDHVLVLTGSIHARKLPNTFGGTTYNTMAMWLAPPDEVVSLLMTFGAGSAWNCQAETPPNVPFDPSQIVCGPHDTRALAPRAGVRRLGLGSPKGGEKDVDAYDGYYWIGPITSSPPAVRRK